MSENASKKNNVNDDVVKAPIITDKQGILGEAGKTYELDFSRKTALYTISQGIDVGEDNMSKRISVLPTFFYCAFRKNHPSVAREKVDKLREANRGISTELVSRLYELLAQALSANVLNVDEDEEKNVAMDVEL